MEILIIILLVIVIVLLVILLWKNKSAVVGISNEELKKSEENINNRFEVVLSNLGKLETISGGISSLNKIFTNVKTRGTWGEIQLESIIRDALPKNTQYVRELTVRQGSKERVDFAVKIPSQENDNGVIYLPIDAKFPGELSIQELKQRISTDASNIHDRYINPPFTTDFAIMFLPTESLYAEVLSIKGLAETCQKRYHVTIAGPMTITAILNSFRACSASRENIL